MTATEDSTLPYPPASNPAMQEPRCQQSGFGTLGSSDLTFISFGIAKLFGQANPLLQRPPIPRHTLFSLYC